MSKKELCSRYLFFILGILIMSFGIAFMIRSHLGNSPISSLPYVFSEMFPCTVGMCTFIMNLLLMALQLIIMGKRFPKSYWLQIPVSVIFGAFVDFVRFSSRLEYSEKQAVIASACPALKNSKCLSGAT